MLWDYDTVRPLDTTNGVNASGGSLESAGPTLAGRMLFVNSGYGLQGGHPGNVLLMLAPR